MESEIKKILNLENVEVAHLRYKGNKKKLTLSGR